MGIEESVKNLIEKPILALGYTEVSVKYVKEFGTQYLRILVDRDDVIDLEDIVKVNDLVSPLLDEADLIQNEYVLDVTSFGAEKPIKVENLEKQSVYLKTTGYATGIYYVRVVTSQGVITKKMMVINDK